MKTSTEEKMGDKNFFYREVYMTDDNGNPIVRCLVENGCIQAIQRG